MYSEKQNDILRLNVPVRNFKLMHILEGINGLLHVPGSDVLGALELVHEDAALRVLHQQEDVILVIEVSVQFYDVGVIQPIMDLQLSRELGDHVVLQDCGLEYFLQGVQSSCGLMFTDVHVAELTRPHIFAQLKILETHWFSENYRFFNNISLVRFLLNNTIKFKLTSLSILIECVWVMHFHGHLHVSIPCTPKTLDVRLFAR